MAIARLDDTFGRPELRAVRGAADTGDWARLWVALTDNVADRQDTDDRIDVAARTVSARSGSEVPTGLDQWTASRPQDPLAHLFRGAVEATRAWKIRGYGSSQATSPTQFQGFHAVLDRAEASLRSAAYLDPASPSPWRWLLHIARGQQVGLAETMKRREELAARDPDHFFGHYEAIESVSTSWGYSSTRMDECLAAWLPSAGPDSPLPALVFVANIERLRRPGDGGPVLADKAAIARAREATATMRMDRCTRPAEFWAHNYAATWYSQARDLRRCHDHMRLLRGYVTEWPWGDFVRTPRSAFLTNRLTVMWAPGTRRPGSPARPRQHS